MFLTLACIISARGGGGFDGSRSHGTRATGGTPVSDPEPEHYRSWYARFGAMAGRESPGAFSCQGEEGWLVGHRRDLLRLFRRSALHEAELDVTDGCAAQFNGKDNYHQVAVWKIKTGVARNHSISITMHGKNICDALANVIQAALASSTPSAVAVAEAPSTSAARSSTAASLSMHPLKLRSGFTSSRIASSCSFSLATSARN